MNPNQTSDYEFIDVSYAISNGHTVRDFMRDLNRMKDPLIIYYFTKGGEETGKYFTEDPSHRKFFMKMTGTLSTSDDSDANLIEWANKPVGCGKPGCGLKLRHEQEIAERARIEYLRHPEGVSDLVDYINKHWRNHVTKCTCPFVKGKYYFCIDCWDEIGEEPEAKGHLRNFHPEIAES